jgi:hypothetical protein
MPAIPLSQRLWYYVTPNDSTGCWEWTGAFNGTGYGRLSHYGRTKLAHRVAYETCKGDLGDGWVMHTCDNRKCVNPAHLVLGDSQANVDDMIAKGRAYHPSPRPDPTRCKSGKHPWEGQKCRACHAERRRARTGMVKRPWSRY